jgi:hypothetical protein
MAALVLSAGAALSPVNAQALPRSFASLRYAPPELKAAPAIPSVQLADSTLIPETYWLEGALVGGAPAGLLFGAFAGGFCNDPDSGGGNESCWDDALLGLVGGFAAGGSLGALIGGQFKKSRKPRKPAGPLPQDSILVVPR